MKLNLVGGKDQIQYPEKAGDAIIIDYKTHIGLVWCCPKCGQITSTARGSKHVFNIETNSLTPSIVHNIKLGGCGYHGFLTNGEFKEI